MEMLRDEDLAILARGVERAYLRDSRLMAQELIMRRAGATPEPEVAKRPLPYDYDGILIMVPSATLANALWNTSFSTTQIGVPFFYQSGLTGFKYICYRIS